MDFVEGGAAALRFAVEGHEGVFAGASEVCGVEAREDHAFEEGD